MNAPHQNRTVVLLLLLGILVTQAGCLGSQARNIILMIGDGMGPSQIGAAWNYSTRVQGKELYMVEVMKSGRTAYITNDNAGAIVTESAAAATQIATGVRVTAGVVAMSPDGKTPLKTIMELAKDKRMGTGLVTTSEITDATPAAFAAHVAHRSDEASVALQQLHLGVDVLLGGGKRFFLPETMGGKRKDGRDLLEGSRRAGYTVVGTASEFQQANSGKILGLFTMGNMAYEIDRGKTAEPSLADMTAKTLEVLARNPKGFFVMIEGGRIDHAAHRNDAAGTIRDVLAFDDAVGVALDFQKRNPDTLLIVTADHETGGMAVVGNDLSAIQKAQASLEVILNELGNSPTPEMIRDAVKRHLGIELREAEAKVLADDTIRKPGLKNYKNVSIHSLALVLRPYLGVSWASQTHTASPLFAFGSGPGSEEVVGFRHNTELFRIMKSALEVGR